VTIEQISTYYDYHFEDESKEKIDLQADNVARRKRKFMKNKKSTRLQIQGDPFPKGHPPGIY
jgi:hypothetical protein